MTSFGGGEVAKIGVAVVGYSLVMIVLAWVVGRIIGEFGPLFGALMLAAAFPNSGFVGIPLSEFAFGDLGRTTAVVFLTVQNVVYTHGVFIASHGSDRSTAGAISEIFRLPLLYAIFSGVIVRAAGVAPPAMQTVGLVGDASITVMLLILGIQLAKTDITAVSRSVAPTALKLVVAPVVGIGFALALGFGDPTVAKVFVIECAIPAAVIPLALTIEYADDVTVDGITAPEYLSTTIFTTTVASIAVLTVLVSALQAGMVF